jgi:release factor glutamine methyltransferase
LTDKKRIDEALRDAAGQLQSVSDSARLDAEILLALALDVDRSYLFGHPDDVMDAVTCARFSALVTRRADGVPLAYITGEKEFWSLEMMVSSDTLVPRPETEMLVQLALDRIDRDSTAAILDLGTGSGAIALAIARERPNSEITATDISAPALAIAAQNARQLDAGNVQFLEGDWVAPVCGRTFDLIVSNPPYVCSNDPALDTLRHEPRSALESGLDGLRDIRTLAADCGGILRAGGQMLVEHGADQGSAVEQILREHGWTDIECHRDLAGLPRVVSAKPAP